MAIMEPATVPFQGNLQTQPIQNCALLNSGAKTIIADINWSLYDTAVGSLGALIDFSYLAPSNGLDKIVSVFVDNTGVNSSVTVYAPDTKYGKEVAPQTQQTFVVPTNGLKLIVTCSNNQETATTRMIVANVILPDYSSNDYAVLGLASPRATLGQASLYRAFALGDTVIAQPSITLVMAPLTIALIAAQPVGFTIITEVHLSLQRFISNTLGLQNIEIALQTTDGSFKFVDLQFTAPTDMSMYNQRILYASSGLQWLYPSTKTLAIVVTSAAAAISGTLDAVVTYTLTTS